MVSNSVMMLMQPCLLYVQLGKHRKSCARPGYAAQICRLTMPHLVVQAIEDGEEAVNHDFIRQALQPIVSMLLEQLTKQEAGQDRDEGIWNLSMAAGTCLGLVSQCVRDEIVGLVMPYVQVCCIAVRRNLLRASSVKTP